MATKLTPEQIAARNDARVEKVNAAAKARNAKNNVINYAAMMTAMADRYNEQAETFRAVLPNKKPGKNSGDDFLDTIRGEAAVAQNVDDMVNGFAAIDGAEHAAGEAGDVLRLRKFVYGALVARRLTLDLTDKTITGPLLERLFPKASDSSRTAYLSYLKSFVQAEKAGLLDDLIASMKVRVETTGGRIFDAVKGALVAAKKAADGHKNIEMKMPDAEALDKIVAPKASAPAARVSNADKPIDDLMNAVAGTLKAKVQAGEDIETMLTLLRAKLDAFRPRAQGPVTDKNDLAPKH